MRHRFIQKVNENMQTDQALSTSFVSAHGFKGQHVVDIMPYHFMLPVGFHVAKVLLVATTRNLRRCSLSSLAEEKEALVVGRGCKDEHNGCILTESVIATSFSNESPGGSMLGLKGGSDDATSARGAGSTNLDCSIEEPKLERCHRSNGKQWRCTKNATGGTLYCELHHAYLSKCKLKRGGSSKKKPQPYIQRQKAKISTSMHMELQRLPDCCLKQLDVDRCRRTDGKLWQCSKQVMPGSSYCENHHNWRRKKQKASCHVAGKNKPDVEEPPMWAVDNGSNACSAFGSCEDGHVIGGKELEGKSLTEVCGGLMCTKAQSHEDGYHRKTMQSVQMGEKDGLVSGMDGWKQDTVEHASLCISSPESKKSVYGFGEFTEMGSSEKASQAESSNTCCSQDTNADSRGNHNRGAIQCRRNDGKQWQCSQLCKPGSIYCEHHQDYQQKVRARVNEHAKVKTLENEETRVKGSARKFDNKRQATSRRHKQAISSADILHHKPQVQKETKQLTDKSSQDSYCVKQCQRKDGKGWQCSQHAKQGYSYCGHHLAYISKRYSLKLYRRESHLLASEDNRKVSTAYESFPSPSPAATLCISKQGLSTGDEPLLGSAVCGLASCRKACPSDTLSIFKQAVGEEVLLGNTAQSLIQREVTKANIRPLEAGSLPYPSTTFSTHHSEDATSHDEHYSSGKNANTVEFVTTPQESFNGSSIVCKSIQTQQVVSMGCTDEVNGCAPKECEVETNFFEKSPPEMKGCSGGLTPVFMASRSNLQEKPKPEQCHRSNGKQWRCSKNASPGTLYCELHHAYMRKCKPKQQAGKNTMPFTEVTPGNKLQSYVLPGSTYCENHHKRCMVSKKKRKGHSLVAGKNKLDVEEPQMWAVDNGARLGSGDKFSKHGHSLGSKEEGNGLDPTLICSYREGHRQEINSKMNVSEVCGRSMPTSVHSHEDGYSGHVDGLLDNVMCSAGVLFHKEQIQKETQQLTDNNSHNECFSKQCQSQDGKGWQCAQHAEQGYGHCEHHLTYINKCNTSELFMKEDHILATEDNTEMSAATGPSSCRTVCPLASPSILEQKRSAGEEPLLGSGVHSSIQKEAMEATNQTSEGSLLYQLATFSTQCSEEASSHDLCHSSQKQATFNIGKIEAATACQESSSDRRISHFSWEHLGATG